MWLIAWAPGAAIDQDNIEKILAMESPVYYADGKNKIGVFFEQAHREYVPYEQIPKAFVDGIVASEDHAFFRHKGIDYMGIFRALITNVRAGKVVQGGSTITQQTAKNLFKRKDRSLKAKLKELLYAWRLEYHYPKEKILEFYANQFYVSGNGRGLGVAARYYFDKPVTELGLLECAFIAGSVKRPNYYNPFIKKNEKAVALARKKAKERVRYVLNQMYKLKMITVSEYQSMARKEIPFEQGQMSYSLNTIMDLVKMGLAEVEVEEALVRHGIDNVAISGMKVYTTIEKDLQESAFYNLRKELSRLDIRLRGYGREALQELYLDKPFASSVEKQRLGFLLGKVVALGEEGSPQVYVSFDKKGTIHGRIDKKGLMNAVLPLTRYKKHAWSDAGKNELADFYAGIQLGDLVYVSIRDVDSFTNEYLLDLEKIPELQGGVLAYKEGTIRAMVGGMDNRYYNRAVMAKRSMGSVIKPLLYFAALQLGWNNLDALNNERNVFSYQKQAYFPRPDHRSPHKWVSMSWAGVNSENLASVWLLYNLCDQLLPAQFHEVAEYLGIGKQSDESHQAFRRRIRDTHGIVVDRKTLMRAAFAKAIESVEPDLLFEGKMDEFERLKRFHYGVDFLGYDQDNEEKRAQAELDGKKEDIAEADKRKVILKRNYLRFIELRQNLAALAAAMAEGVDSDFSPSNLFYNAETAGYLYAEQDFQPYWQPVLVAELRSLLAEKSELSVKQFWQDVTIEGQLSPATLDLLSAAIEQEYGKLAKLPPYSKDVLFHVRDYKVLTGLAYLTELCRTMGIESRLDPVLSFPLGSNVISLLEVARSYEGLQGGRIYKSGLSDAGEGLSIIARIEDVDGEVIYEPKRYSLRVTDEKTSMAITDILRNVVRFGTGRYAERNVRLHSRDPQREAELQALDLNVPVFGKTGTANRFTNAAFAGFIPGTGEQGKLSLGNGYVLSAYVGFDDNTPMQRKTTRLSGASGALPMWVNLANTIFVERDYAGTLDLADLSFSSVSEVPLQYKELGQVVVPVANDKGGVERPARQRTMPRPGRGEAHVTTFGTRSDKGELKLARDYKPFWAMKEY